MKFCPKCKTMMSPKKVDGRTTYRCPKCGYEEEATQSLTIVTRVRHDDKEKMLVLDEQVPAGSQKMKGIICPSCGGDEAFYWMLQTRSADEPITRFYKCTKCGKVWREYE
ncbi:transcription factor S [Sulfodiicoccus acidiphilus]|nr:transcription factor S [Sulfodiicoccus acidiphilus]